MTRVKVLNLEIDNFSMAELLHELKEGVVFTPNTDHLVKVQHDEEFLSVYDHANYRVCDSKIVYYAAQFLGTPLKEKISGSDLFPEFYKYHQSNDDIRIFLLGAREGVAEEAKGRINRSVNREIIVETYSPPFGFENNEAECQKIITLVKRSGATVLAVGLGAPKQENFIVKFKEQMPEIKIFLAIGATIDFEAGRLPRAPKWTSEWGLEWAYRLINEPKRLWKRYLLDDPMFLWLILRQKFHLYTCPFHGKPTSLEAPVLSSTEKF